MVEGMLVCLFTWHRGNDATSKKNGLQPLCADIMEKYINRLWRGTQVAIKKKAGRLSLLMLSALHIITQIILVACRVYF